jgi:hypothetical protein
MTIEPLHATCAVRVAGSSGDSPRLGKPGVNGYLRATEYSTVTTAFTIFSTVLVS